MSKKVCRKDSSFWMVLITMITCLMYWSSGCGTEIGNGWSTPDKPGRSDGGAGAENKDEQDTANNPASQSNDPGADAGTSWGSGVSTDYPTSLYSAIFNSCGSPFVGMDDSELEYENSMNMVTKNDDYGIIFLRSDASEAWFGTAGSTYNFRANDNGKAGYLNSSGQPGEITDTGFTCSGDIEEEEDQSIPEKTGTFVMFTSNVELNSVEYTLRWFVEENIDSSTKDRIVKIELINEQEDKQEIFHEDF